MTISVTDPFGQALERTARILFQPFDLTKWLTLGFCAWLATMGEGGGGAGGGFSGDDPRGLSNQLEQGREWAVRHAGLLLLGGGAIVLGVFLIAALVLWLKARGRFMFIDGIVHDRGAVKEPWAAFRDVARRVFVFELMLTVAVGFTLSLAVAGGFYLAWGDMNAGRFEGGALAGLVFGVGLMLIAGVTGGLIGWILDNFIVPALYLHGGGIGDAWALVREEIFASRTGTILLYLLMRIGLSIVGGIGALCVTCATCCLTVIPYVGTVILLPLFVFLRCYNLSFLEQFGERWRFYRFELAAASPPPPE
ncbi:MAG: hypothetical protein QF410_08300 [Planctomycetota bacterium]|jgi:hypothetical protein|nr:hypothetical protein [Planctomycetota bacterium]MDP6410307.1 hypothetical protein [Planctomycetota bacterium]MDP6539535.1 hypothetical protein [Planctomycetota bacterium]